MSRHAAPPTLRTLVRELVGDWTWNRPRTPGRHEADPPAVLGLGDVDDDVADALAHRLDRRPSP